MSKMTPFKQSLIDAANRRIVMIEANVHPDDLDSVYATKAIGNVRKLIVELSADYAPGDVELLAILVDDVLAWEYEAD